LCADAPTIPEIPYCDHGTTNGYAANYFNSCNGGGPDVVYRYTPAVNETVRFSLCGSNFDCVLALWRGCPGEDGEQILCNDDFCGTSSCLASPLTAGEIYYAVINGYEGGTGDYRFHAVPVNFGCPGTRCGDQRDDCMHSEFVVAGSELPQVFAGSTIGATLDSPSVAPNCTLPTGPGVWFQFTGGDSTAVISLTSIITPHQLFAFCGSCTDLTCIAAPACDALQSGEFCTQLGTDYFLLVAACTEATGTFELNLAFTAPCAPPVCTVTVLPPVALTIGRRYPDIILRWQAPDGPLPDHYLIYRSPDAVNLIAPEHQIAVRSGFDYTDSNILLTPQARMYYAVTSVMP
jgi:hypothetical protein